MWLLNFAVFMEDLGGPPCARVLTAADRSSQSMRGSFLSCIRVWLVLLLSLWMFSTHVLWAQRTSPLEDSAAHLPDAPAPAATVPEPHTNLHLTCRGSPLTFRQNRDGTLDQRTSVGKPWGRDRFFIGDALAKGMTYAPAYGHAYHETIHGAHDLQYYGHHIPGAGFHCLASRSRGSSSQAYHNCTQDGSTPILIVRLSIA